MPELIPVRSVRNGGLDHIEVPTADEALIAALLRERDGYRQYSRHDDAAQVDAELARLGYVEHTPEPVKGADHGRDRADRPQRQPARRRPAAGGE